MVKGNNQEDIGSKDQPHVHLKAKKNRNISEYDHDGSDDEMISDAEDEVRENEDASLQDKSYSFDEENTDSEEYHDADDADLADIEDEDSDINLH